MEPNQPSNSIPESILHKGKNEIKSRTFHTRRGFLRNSVDCPPDRGIGAHRVPRKINNLKILQLKWPLHRDPSGKLMTIRWSAKKRRGNGLRNGRVKSLTHILLWYPINIPSWRRRSTHMQRLITLEVCCVIATRSIMIRFQFGAEQMNVSNPNWTHIVLGSRENEIVVQVIVFGDAERRNTAQRATRVINKLQI